MPDEQFDPRTAALQYAGAVVALTDRLPSVGEHLSGRIVAEAVNAITCGLVYVGDQIAQQSAVLTTPVGGP